LRRHDQPNLNVSIVLQTLFINKFNVKSVLKLSVKYAKLLDLLKKGAFYCFSAGDLFWDFAYAAGIVNKMAAVICPDSRQRGRGPVLPISIVLLTSDRSLIFAIRVHQQQFLPLSFQNGMLIA